MRIRYLDGRRLKRALIAGSRRVQSHKEQLNTINVFPVADSDTGTNMSGTLRALVGGISETRGDLEEISQLAADSTLTGAKGNSGTILSQLFYGIAQGSKKKRRIDTKAFSSILKGAVDYTYRALAEPVEGTILTVLRVWSQKVEEYSSKTDDFVKLLSYTLQDAKSALKETTKQLPNLRKAKVVDAGALGVVHFIEGIVRFIDVGRIRDLDNLSDFEEEEQPQDYGHEDVIIYRYCTECVIIGEGIRQDELKEKFSRLGDSLIVAGSDTKIKLHIHTDQPEKVFDVASEYGTLEQQKADDMHKQYLAAHSQHVETALVVDSASDIPENLMEQSYVHMVPVKLLYGEKSYLDRIALSPEHYYKMLDSPKANLISTSQPSPGEFERSFSFLSEHYRDIIYLSLASILSGTMKSALSARDKFKGQSKIHVIDSKTATVGIALIARRISEAIEKQLPIEEVRTMVENLSERSRLLITIPSLEALMRSGRLGKVRGFLAKMLHLRPILTLDHKGRIVKAAMVRGAEAGKKKLISLLRSRLGDGAVTDFAIAHVDDLKTAEWFREELLRYFRTEREIFIRDASPALATHTGFGTLAVAYIDTKE